MNKIEEMENEQQSQALLVKKLKNHRCVSVSGNYPMTVRWCGLDKCNESNKYYCQPPNGKITYLSKKL